MRIQAAITKSGDITNNFRAMNWQIDWNFSMDTMKAGATLTDRFDEAGEWNR